MMRPQTVAPLPRAMGQEALLIDYLRKLERHRAGRRAVIVHLSLLQPQNRREHHIRVASNAFADMAKVSKGQLFTLGSSDLVFIFKEQALEETEAAVVKLRFMFSDDPLLVDDGRAGKPSFCDWFLLTRDYDALTRLAQHALEEEQTRRSTEFVETYASTAAARTYNQGDLLTPTTLARIEEALSRSDLSNLIRRQAISAIVGHAPPQPVFQELFISIADLREAILPNVNLASSPWLFQQLTETLDRRVLALLNKHDDRTIDGDISINVNVQTILSPEFLVFDDNLRAAMRGTIVLEVQKVDLFSDLGAFLFARDFAHDRGYRICIDGVGLDALPFIDRERLAIDLVKMSWSPQMNSGKLPDGESLSEYIARCGPSRTILCRCDGQDAILAGQGLGITLFQGRHVEALIADEARRTKGLAARRRYGVR